MRVKAIHRHRISAGSGGIARLRRFAQDEGGSVTVEMVLWLPFIFGILMLIIDVSLAFFGRAQAFRVIQDVNRAVSVGLVDDADAAETMLLAAFEPMSPNATADVTVANGFVRTVLTIPAKDMILFSSPFLLHFYSDVTMTVGAQHYLEWPYS